MKECNACGKQVDEQAEFCSACGSTDLTETMSAAEKVQQFDQTQTFPPVFNPINQDQSNESGENSGNGNILAGVVGAFLFSLIGGALYFLIYQIGFVAGICGLVIFVLANFGYGLFAKTKNNTSMVGLITAILMTVVMIFLAEIFCISFEIFQEFKDFDITIFDAIKATPDFLAEPEISEAVLSDLAFAYIFGFVASISSIVNIVKARKKSK